MCETRPSPLTESAEIIAALVLTNQTVIRKQHLVNQRNAGSIRYTASIRKLTLNRVVECRVHRPMVLRNDRLIVSSIGIRAVSEAGRIAPCRNGRAECGKPFTFIRAPVVEGWIDAVAREPPRR